MAFKSKCHGLFPFLITPCWRDQHTFSVKGPMVNILGFAGHAIRHDDPTLLLEQQSSHRQSTSSACGCVPIKLILKPGAGFSPDKNFADPCLIWIITSIHGGSKYSWKHCHFAFYFVCVLIAFTKRTNKQRMRVLSQDQKYTALETRENLWKLFVSIGSM